MRYRKLLAGSKADESPLVSVVGFGCSGIGGLVFGDVDPQDAVKAFKRALELGINYFDTSPFYGLTNSEKVLGLCLKASGISRGKVVISSKVGRYGDKEFDFSAERITKSIDESLQRIGVDYLDIVFCHDIEFIPDTSQIINETIPALRKLKDQGKLKYIGVSGYPLPVLDEIVKKSQPNGIDIVLTYCHYNLYNQDAEAYAKNWKENYGVSAINASALGMGLITDNEPPEWHPAPTELKQAVKSAGELLRKEGKHLSKESLRFAFASPLFPSTLVGIKNIDEVEFAVNMEEANAENHEIPQQVLSLFHGIKTSWSSGINPLGQR